MRCFISGTAEPAIRKQSAGLSTSEPRSTGPQDPDQLAAYNDFWRLEVMSGRKIATEILHLFQSIFFGYCVHCRNDFGPQQTSKPTKGMFLCAILSNEKLDIALCIRGAQIPAERADWVLKGSSALGKSDIEELAMSFDSDGMSRNKRATCPSY